MPPEPDPQLAQARSAESRGDLRTAANHYQAVIKRNPHAPEAHYALGLLLARAGQAQQALPSLERAASLDEGNTTYHHTLGVVLAGLNQLDKALEAHNRARRADPSNATAHVDAAFILEMRAQADEARQAVTDALAADPADERARILAIRLDFRAATPDAETLASYRTDLRQIADDTQSPVHRALALDILIDVCERLADYDVAWTAITQCNEADRTVTGRALPTPEQRRARLKSIDDFAALMNPERAQRWQAQCPADGLPSPAVLVGFPRSGTTLTERALDAHPRLTSIEERRTFARALESLNQLLPRAVVAASPGYEILDALTPDLVARLRHTYWRHACGFLNVTQPPHDRVVLDKMPLLLTNLPFVTRLFPDAKILVALRDPRDVCLSCLRQRFGYVRNVAMSFFLDLHDTATLYSHVMNAWLTKRDAYPNPVLEIRYEDTVADFEARIRAMLDFLGLEFDEAVLSFHERTDRIHNTPSFHAVSKRVSTGAVGRWRNYEAHLEPILPALAPFLSGFGYGS